MPKKKKDWRAADVKDVQSHLEEKVQVSVPNEQLFVLDKVGQLTQFEKKKQKDLEKKRLKEERKAKLQKKEEQKRKKKEAKRKRTEQLKEEHAKAKANNIDMKDNEENEQKGKKRRKKRRKTTEKGEQNNQSNGAPKKQNPFHNVSNIWAEVRPEIPKKLKKKKRPFDGPERAHLNPSNLTVVHPGLSVNPHPEAQQDMLKKAFEIDQKLKTEHEAILKNFRAEPASTKTKSKEEEKESKEEEEVEAPPVGSKVVVVERLTTAQKNKKKRKKLLAEEEEKRIKQKMLKAQLNALPTILTEISKEEKEHEEKKKILKEKKKNPNKPIRLGPQLFQEDFPEYVLTEESKTGQMRDIKPSLKIIKDQFKKFQAKNIIEPRKKLRLKPRYKPKTYNTKDWKGEPGV